MEQEPKWGDDLTKEKYWYIGPLHPNAEWLWGYVKRGQVADFISTNCRKIRETEDKSPWAINLFGICCNLLKEGKRWPDALQVEIPRDRQCKTRLGSFFNKYKFQVCKHVLKLKDETYTQKSRSWGDMTRDPYIQAFATAIYLGDLKPIYEISIPFYLYRPKTWTWHKFLKKPTEKNLRRYNFWKKFSPTTKLGFVKGLQVLRDYAVENRLTMTPRKEG